MLLKNGVDIEAVGELMGHSAVSITQIYLHSTGNQKQDAVNKINYLCISRLTDQLSIIENTEIAPKT